MEEKKKLKKSKITEEGRRRLREYRLGKKMSQESKDKLREYRLGKKWSQEVKDKIRESSEKYKVYQYDKDYNLINEYESIIDASRKSGLDYRNLWNTLHGNQKTCGGYIWELSKKKIRPDYLKDEEEDIEKIDRLYMIMYEMIEDAYINSSLVGFKYNDRVENRYREYLKKQWELLSKTNYTKGCDAIQKQIDKFITPENY